MNATEHGNIREKIAKCSEKKTPGERQDCINQIIVESIETLDRHAEETGSDTKLILASMSAFQNNLRDEMRNFRESVDNKIDRLEHKVDERFNKVDERLNGIEKCVGMNGVDIAQIKTWVGNIHERVSIMEPKIEMLEKTIKEHFSRKTPGEMHR